MTASIDLTDLPDPTDRTAAWHDGVPAYLAWWKRLVAVGAEPHEVYRHVHQHDLTSEYAEAVPDTAALAVLADLGPLLEIGAGGGYWARLLRDRGADVLAVDLPDGVRGSWDLRGSPWTDVVDGDHRSVIAHPDRMPFVCWPPRPSGFATDVVQLATQDTVALITVGPKRVTETSTDPLWEALERGGFQQARRVDIPTWHGRGDHLSVWRR